MKKLLFLILLAGFCFAHRSHAANYTYYRAVTVTSSAANASGTQSDFPVLFNTTANWLKTSSTDSTNGRIQQVNAWDLVFTTSTPTASGANWSCTAAASEIERYTSSTGELIAWFRASTIASSSAYYVCYGSGGVSATPEASSSVWDSNFVAVWHIPDGSTLGLKDSTSNARNLTNTGSGFTAAAGQVDGGAAALAGNSPDLVTAAFSMGTTLTVEGWIKNTNNGNSAMYFEKTPVNAAWEIFGDGVNLILRGGATTNSLSVALPSQSVFHHIVGTITGTSGVIYIDGTATSGTVDAVGDTSTAVHLGNYDNSAYYFTGTEDEVRISNVVRSSAWVTTEYNNQARSDFYSVGAETAGASGVATYSSLVSLQGGSCRVKGGSVQIK